VSADAVELVERFLEFREAGNVDACVSLVADSSVWHSPVGPPLRGRQGFREALEEAYVETRWFATETLGVRRHGAAVVAKVRNRGERRGETLDSMQLLLFQVADGLIIDVCIYVDDPAAVTEFWSD
jgi:ketosteroid isomerase-like protein